MDSREKKTENRAINGGLASNVLLAIAKVGFGVFGHSEALLADGINSTSDVAYYVVVKVCVFFARKPPDREHPYGHRQLESIAALAVGSFVITTAVALFWDAINNVYDILTTRGASIPVGAAALWVALVTVGVKIALTLYTQRAAVVSGNPAILALARDHRNDIFSASGAALGILAARAGWPWADPLVGAVVAVVVLFTGIQVLRESATDLMDGVPSSLLERETREILRNIPGVLAVEEILAHRFGPFLVVHLTIGVDGQLSVADGDRIASEVEKRMCAGISLLRRVHVHYHPVRVTAAPRP